MRLCKAYKPCKHGWIQFAFIFLLPTFAVLAKPPAEDRLYYHRLQDITVGLSTQETEKLKKYFEHHRAVDLERSGLTAAHAWFTELSKRLTTASEKIGSHFGTYRVFLVPSENWGAIYKYRPDGQKYFRGYVFISTHSMEHFCKSIGVLNPSQLSDAQLELFLDGVVGLASHQFAHPRESELIEWNKPPEAHEKIKIPEYQAANIATDMVALRLLREASFPVQSLLSGFELLLSYPPTSKRDIEEAAKNAEPHTRLRLNIIRAALLQDQIAKGDSPNRRIPYDAIKLRGEIHRLLDLASLPVGDHPTPILALLEGLSININKIHQISPEQYIRYLIKIRDTLKDRGGDVQEIEVQAMISFARLLVEHQSGFLSRHRYLHAPHGREREHVFIKYLSAYPIATTRKIQKIVRQIPIFSHPLFIEWIESGTDNISAVFDVKEKGGMAESGYQTIPQILPMKQVLRIYQLLYLQRKKTPPLERVRHFVEMLHGNITGGGNVGLDLKLIREIRSYCEQSKKITKALIEVMEGLVFAVPQSIFQSRLREFDTKFPEKRGALLHEYALLMRHIMADPTLRLIEAIGNHGNNRGPNPLKRVSEILVWDMIPDSFLQPFNADSKLPADDLFNYYVELLQSPAWRKGHIALLHTLPTARYLGPTPFQSIAATLAISDKTAFNEVQRLQLFQLLEGRHLLGEMGMTETDPKYLAMRAALSNYYGEILNYSGDCVEGSRIHIKSLVEWFRDLNCKSAEEFFKLIQPTLDEKFKDAASYLFDGNIGRHLLFLHQLRAEKLITQADWAWSVREALLPTGDDHRLLTASIDAIRQLWRACKEAKIEGLDFLRLLQSQFDVRPNKTNGAQIGFRSWQETKNDDAIAIGAKFHPYYYTVLAALGGPLESEFLKILGVRRSHPEYAKLFTQRFADVLAFYRNLFNADGIPIAIHLRSIYSTTRLDDLTSRFLNLIPSVGLTLEQEFQLWQEMVSKRSNRYTDAFFENRVFKFITQLSPQEKTEKIEFFLRHEFLHSERLKIFYTEQILAQRISDIEKQPSIGDSELYSLISDIQYYCPRSSRFRDEYLERIAGKLRLNEGQLVKFIEPAKSFNYGAIDPLIVNLLSGLVVYLEDFSIPERMRLVRYIREPEGDILEETPSIKKAIAKLEDTEEKPHRALALQFVEQLESFIRDAGETERHVLLELVIGTPQIGLWYQSEKIREELLSIAGLGSATSKGQLLATHLQARAAYQHSLIVSYLLAEEDGKGQEIDLVRILENFRAPGKKTADIFGVLGIFPEHREALLKMKGWTLIPSRYETFQWLKAVYSESTYNQIADIQVLGGGAIKVVVLVKFKNGSEIVASLKRPHIEDTNRSNISLFRRWIENIRKLPQWENKADYGYLVDLLETQLEMDSDFITEFKNVETLNALYQKAKPKRDWAFGVLSPASSSEFPQNAEVMHFKAIQNTVRYELLPEAERRAAAELIVEHELYLLLELGVFEAERLSSNYLFSPLDRKVYVVDTPQLYRLQRKNYFKTDDRMLLAQIFRGLFASSPEQGAQEIVTACLQLDESGKTATLDRQRIQENLLPILQLDIDIDDKMAKLVAELHRSDIRLPVRFTLGIVKALTILSNEEYSKDIPKDFIRNRIAAFVKTQTIRQGISNFVQAPAKWIVSSCHALVKNSGHMQGD